MLRIATGAATAASTQRHRRNVVRIDSADGVRQSHVRSSNPVSRRERPTLRLHAELAIDRSASCDPRVGSRRPIHPTFVSRFLPAVASPRIQSIPRSEMLTVPPPRPTPRPASDPASAQPVAAESVAKHRPPGSAGAIVPGGLRSLTEWLVLLALAVTLFRGFARRRLHDFDRLDGPLPVGYHTRITCPSCGMTFAHGRRSRRTVRSEQSPRTAQAQAVGQTRDRSGCRPLSRIAAELSPPATLAERTEGDQLLVHKDAYAWRNLARRGGPRRWEIAIFHTPDDAQMAYVKRIVGLPGEAIELVDGDVFADGKLQRKPLAASSARGFPCRCMTSACGRRSQLGGALGQRSRRLRLDRSAARGSSTVRAPPRIAPRPATARSRAWDWITYRHWIRSGGADRRRRSRWPAGRPDWRFPIPCSPAGVRRAEQRLTCLGALLPRPMGTVGHGHERHRRSRRHSGNCIASRNRPADRCLVVQLRRPPDESIPIHDLLLELTLDWRGGTGEFAIEMTDGTREFRAELDFGRAKSAIVADDSETLSHSDILGRPRRRRRSC